MNRIFFDPRGRKLWSRLLSQVLVVLLLAVGSAALNAATLKQKSFRLIAGGPVVKVTATGADAKNLSKFVVTKTGTGQVQTIAVIRRVTFGANTTIELRAKPTAVPSPDYTLEGKTASGKSVLNVRFSVVSKLSTTLPKFGPAIKLKVPRNRLKPRVPLKFTPAEAPVVTSWEPREKAHAGMILVINGPDLNHADIKVKIGSGTRSVQLAISQRSATRMTVRIPDTAYTGRRGLPLVVYGLGTKENVLLPNFQVLNRQAIFSGDSLWHANLTTPMPPLYTLRQGLVMEATPAIEPTLSDPIFTRGKVSLRLDLFEFSDGGSGTYSEVTPLPKRLRTHREKCTVVTGSPERVFIPADGERVVSDIDFRPERVSRRITWRRLADGRIELTNIGLGVSDLHVNFTFKFTAIGIANDQSLNLNYKTFSVFGTGKTIALSDCRTLDDQPKANSTNFSDHRYLRPSPIPVPVMPEWILERRDLP